MVTSTQRNAGKPQGTVRGQGRREGAALGRKGEKMKLLPTVGRKKEEDIKTKQNDMGQNQQPEEKH